MTIIMISLLMIFLVTFLLGFPIGFSLLIASTLAFLFLLPQPPDVLAQKFYTNVATFPLMAVPFFMLATELMRSGGISRRIVDMANAILGRLPGGLALAGLFSCVLFATVSGSSMATVAAVGSIVVPEMIKRNYSPRFAVGSIVSGGTLGIVLPPSIPLIIFGLVTSTSIPRLFLAGIVPGLILALGLMTVTLVGARLTGLGGMEPVEAAVRWRWIRNGMWTLLVPLTIFVGIYGVPEFRLGPVSYRGGAVFTPTEAAIVTVLSAVLVAAFIYRELSLRQLVRAFSDSSRRIGSILLIITGAITFGFVLEDAGIPQALADWLVAQHMPVWLFLLSVNVLLFFAGDFMDAIPIILIFVPVLFPAAIALGIDPVHFGIMTAVNMEMGAITPPIGMNLFMASQISGLDLYQVLRASAPWILVVVFVLVLVTYLPQLSLWLPNHLLGPSL